MEINKEMCVSKYISEYAKHGQNYFLHKETERKREYI